MGRKILATTDSIAAKGTANHVVEVNRVESIVVDDDAHPPTGLRAHPGLASALMRIARGLPLFGKRPPRRIQIENTIAPYLQQRGDLTPDQQHSLASEFAVRLQAGLQIHKDRQRLTRRKIREGRPLSSGELLCCGLCRGSSMPEKTTLHTLAREVLPKVPPLSPTEIIAIRERAGVDRTVIAGFLNVAAETVRQWECGEHRPTGAALRLLHAIKGGSAARNGLVELE